MYRIYNQKGCTRIACRGQGLGSSYAKSSLLCLDGRTRVESPFVSKGTLEKGFVNSTCPREFVALGKGFVNSTGVFGKGLEKRGGLEL